MVPLHTEAQRRLSFARALRNNATVAEVKLWRALSRVRPRLTRQPGIGTFVGDGACRRAGLVAEVDGSQHASSERAIHRTAAPEANGWRVIGFGNSETAANLDGVIEAIIAAAAPRLPAKVNLRFVDSRADRPRAPKGRKMSPAAVPARAGG